MNAVEISLPFPPSVNAIWRSNRGRVHRSQEYEAWEKEAGLVWLTQRPSGFQLITGPFHVKIRLVRPDNRRRDLDNRTKGLLDMAQKNRIIEDDCNVESIDIAWATEGDPCRMVLTPGEFKEEHPSPEKELYARGREVLGPTSGGLVTKLLKAKVAVALARAAIEIASTKNDPAAYVSGIIRSTNTSKGDAW